MTKIKKESYEDLSNELDKIVTDLQDGKLDINEATEAYERGINLLRILEKHLDQTENRVKKIQSEF